MGLLGGWVRNVRDQYFSLSTPTKGVAPSYWREFMDSSFLHVRCLGVGYRSPLVWSRILLLTVILFNVTPIFMTSATAHIFVPELKWECLNEIHMGRSTLCELYDIETGIKRKRMVCGMEYGHDYLWNFTFTNSPLIQFDAFCPLERSVESKRVNYLGHLCGSLICGIFIDSLGRRNIALFTTFFTMASTFSYYVCNNIIMYTYQEFIKGLFASSAFMALLTWAVELAEAKFCSFTVTLFFVMSGMGHLATVAITYYNHNWKHTEITIAVIALFLFPVLFLVPMSLRYIVAKGVVGKEEKLGLPKSIDFDSSDAQPARARDCITKPQSRRLLAINTLTLVSLGFSSHLLMDFLSIVYRENTLFYQQLVQGVLMLLGFTLSLFFSLLPMMLYLLNVLFILVAGIFAIIAATSNNSDSHWSLTRVLAGLSFLFISSGTSAAFTSMKQIPTLNRGFYVSSLNGAWMLGNLLYIILQSFCLKGRNISRGACTDGGEDTRLLTGGIILLVTAIPALLNTYLCKNIVLPHSYRELRDLVEMSHDSGGEPRDVERSSAVQAEKLIGNVETSL